MIFRDGGSATVPNVGLIVFGNASKDARFFAEVAISMNPLIDYQPVDAVLDVTVVDDGVRLDLIERFLMKHQNPEKLSSAEIRNHIEHQNKPFIVHYPGVD